MNIEEHLHIDYLYGCCPVQAEGDVDDKPFYFRARGSHWSFALSEDTDNCDTTNLATVDFYVEERCGNGPFDAGYMPLEVAQALIMQCAEEYLTSGVKPPCLCYRKTKKGVIKQGKWLHPYGNTDLSILKYRDFNVGRNPNCRAKNHDFEQLEYYKVLGALDHWDFSSLEEAIRKVDFVSKGMVTWSD